MSSQNNNKGLQIATISTKELSLVENNMLNTRQLQLLNSKTPARFKRTRKGKGGSNWEYVTGGYVKKVLNLMFGWDWDFEVVEHKFDLQTKQAYVLGKLTVRIPENEENEPFKQYRKIVKMQFGRADIKIKQADGLPLDIGNDLKSATTDALKKCASELGIASDIYQSEEFKELEVFESDKIPNAKEVAKQKQTKKIVTHIEKAKSVTELEQCFTAIPKDNDELLQSYLIKWIELSGSVEELEHIQSEIKDEYHEIIVQYDEKKRELSKT